MIKYSNGFKEVFKLEEVMAVDIEHSAEWKKVDLRIIEKGPNLFYKDKRIGERKLTKILLESNDKTVITLALKMQRADGIRPIGFVAIPLVVCAFVLMC